VLYRIIKYKENIFKHKSVNDLIKVCAYKYTISIANCVFCLTRKKVVNLKMAHN